MDTSNNTFKKDIFNGKVLVLTGGTSKMLSQIALDFMLLGGNVALISRRLEELEKMAKSLESKVKNCKLKNFIFSKCKSKGL